MNCEPIRVLKAEDSPAPADPGTCAIDHAEGLATLADEIDGMVVLLTRWSADPLGVLRRAQPRAVELREQMARVRASGEALTRSYRAVGAFSVAYDDLGGR